MSRGRRWRGGYLAGCDALIREFVLIILNEFLQLDAGDTGERFFGTESIAQAEFFVTREDFAAEIEEREIFGFAIINHPLKQDDLCG